MRIGSLPKWPEVGVQGLAAGHHQHHGAQRDEGDHRLRGDEATACAGFSAASTAGSRSTCGSPSAISTMNHSSVIGPKARPMPPVPKRCAANSSVSTTIVIGSTASCERRRGDRDLQALHRRQHADRRRDDAVAVEDGGAEHAHHHQRAAQARALGHRAAWPAPASRSGRPRRGCRRAGSAARTSARRRRSSSRRSATARPARWPRHRHVAGVEDFLQRVQRAGADVAVDDPQGAQRQGGGDLRTSRLGWIRQDHASIGVHHRRRGRDCAPDGGQARGR